MKIRFLESDPKPVNLMNELLFR